MKAVARVFLTVIALILVCVTALASEGISFDVAASSTELNTGDTLKVEVVVTIVGDEASYSIPDTPVPAIEGFALLSTSSASMKSIAEGTPTVSRTTVFVYKPLAPGTFVIPAMTLEYADESTGGMSALNSAQISVVVAQPPADSGRFLGTIGLGFLVLVIIVVSIIVYLKTQKQRKADDVDTDIGMAEAELKEQLKKVDIAVAHGKLAEGQAVLFTSVTKYLSDSYGLPQSSAAMEIDGEALVESDAPKYLYDIYIKLAQWDGELKYGDLPKSAEEIGGTVDELLRFLEQSSVS
jgi:hypothetical protein